MAVKPTANLAGIELLILDVDGVLTDGSVIIGPEGRESKSFSIVDEHGIRLWKRAGLNMAFLSGRMSDSTNHWADRLDVEHVFQQCHFKLPVVKALLEKLGLSPEAAAYVGDDLPDLPPIKYVGFGAAVANAVDEIKEQADFVTTRSGGAGAVREVIEYILKNSGRWERLMNRYDKN